MSLSEEAVLLVKDYKEHSSSDQFVTDEFLSFTLLVSKRKRKWLLASEVVKKSSASLRASAQRVAGVSRPLEKACAKNTYRCRKCGQMRKSHVCESKDVNNVEEVIVESFYLSSLSIG